LFYDESITASAHPEYGYMWWLNTGKRPLPSAPESVFYAAGFGGNYIVVDSEHDLVIVVRWTGDLDGIIKRVLASIK
jgi:CubicO group peptidase (beta-lactamase class C family)